MSTPGDRKGRTFKGDGFKITVPATVTMYPLDEVIRAIQQGDGAKIVEHHADIVTWLLELKRYREAETFPRCTHCKDPIPPASEPVCGDCLTTTVRLARANRPAVKS